MKRIAVLMLMFAGSCAQADCQDSWLEHQSSTLFLSVDYSQGCYQGELILNFSKFTKKGPQWPDPSLHLKSIPFNRECPTKKTGKDGETIEFSCRKDGASPLAGATYRFKKFKTIIQCERTKLHGIVDAFICISGCGLETPKRLDVPYGEVCS
jgi:hypothetical protein